MELRLTLTEITKRYKCSWENAKALSKYYPFERKRNGNIYTTKYIIDEDDLLEKLEALRKGTLLSNGIEVREDAVWWFQYNVDAVHREEKPVVETYQFK